MKFIDLSKEDRVDILDRVSSELNIRQREVIEKDWWVTAVLRVLFSLPYANHLSFKGGTSLSKCWHLIDRFSEDIDIAVDREFLGFSGTLSKTQISDKLRRAACSFVRDTLQHDLAEHLYNNGFSEDKVKVNVNITPVTTTDPEVININYDSVLSFSIDGTGDNRYILPKVKVEISGRSMSEPISDVLIDSMIDQVYPKAPFAESKFKVRAVLPERTFLEKLFLLHEEFAKPEASLYQKNTSVLLGLYTLADIGIHYDGWTLIDTAVFFKDYGITDLAAIQNLYELIVGDPANYLKYYLGYLEFLNLKKEIAGTQGDDFSQKEFHKAVLDVGPAPFALVYESVRKALSN